MRIHHLNCISSCPLGGKLMDGRTDALFKRGEVCCHCLLVETDSPYLAPQSMRGRDNRPANVVEVLRQLGKVRTEPVEELRAITSANAVHVFEGLR